jgi:ATP-dependent Clp protease ATP-binding subunit ClpA
MRSESHPNAARRAPTHAAPKVNLDMLRHNARCSELVRRVVNAAQQLAVTLEHGTLGTGHLLAALLHERRGIVPMLLITGGLDPQRLYADLDRGQSDLLTGADPALVAALDLSAAYGSHYIGTEHLLLALLALPAFADRLTVYGVDVASLTAAVEDQVRNRR